VSTYDDLTMGTAGAETSPGPTPAPRGRQALAGIIDMAAIGVPYALYARWAQRSADGHALGKLAGGRWNRVINCAMPLLDEQIGSPGAWIVGVRTVDSRTGRRVALWRTLVVVLARTAVGALQRRALGVRPPISEVEHAELARERRAIQDTYRDDPDARNDAMMRLYERRKVNFKPTGWRILAGVVGLVFVNQGLRRCLAPTVVVSRRSQDHSP
jgi:hypothetical protein